MLKTVVDTELPLDEHLLVQKNVISNGQAAKRFCIVTGTHGDELEGQMVCYEMARLLRENIGFLDGTVEIYPALNPLGIDTIQRGIPNFDLDMNRIFPGDEHGTMAEQTAYRICADLKGADLVLDIHSSNLYLRESPQVRINVLNAESLVPIARSLGVDFVWVHDAATVLEATLAHSLNSTGTPCLVAEVGVGQRINRKMCQHLVKGIFNLMKEMGMWNGPIDLIGENSSELLEPLVCVGDRVTFLNAECSGVFLTDLHTAEIVKTGQSIGKIVDPLTGDMLSDVKSPVDGFLFTIRAYPIVYEGSLMARIFRFDKSEENLVKAICNVENKK